MQGIITGLIMALGPGTLVPQPALASGDHRHHKQGMHAQAMDMTAMQGAFLQTKEIDGYTVSFHVMAAKEGMEHGGSHNFMIKIERDGRVITDAMANSKAIHPDGTSESKMMMKMGDWYMAGYDLGHEGRHQLLILFKTADGKKHFTGVYYPAQHVAQEGGKHAH